MKRKLHDDVGVLILIATWAIILCVLIWSVL